MSHRTHVERAGKCGAPDPSTRGPWLGDPWAAVRVLHLEVCPCSTHTTERVRGEAVVHLDRLTPADVRVDLEPDGDGARAREVEWPIRTHSTRSHRNATFVIEARVAWPLAGGLDGLRVRVRPKRAHGVGDDAVSRSFPFVTLGASSCRHSAEARAGHSPSGGRRAERAARLARRGSLQFPLRRCGIEPPQGERRVDICPTIALQRT